MGAASGMPEVAAPSRPRLEPRKARAGKRVHVAKGLEAGAGLPGACRQAEHDGGEGGAYQLWCLKEFKKNRETSPRRTSNSAANGMTAIKLAIDVAGRNFVSQSKLLCETKLPEIFDRRGRLSFRQFA